MTWNDLRDFVREIHRDSPHKGARNMDFNAFLFVTLNKLLKFRWFKTP